MLNKFPYFVQQDPSHNAKALPPKYPEVGLPSPKGPMIVDPHLRAEVVVRGLRYPTSMAFLGPNDILVTEKDAGAVRRVINNTELHESLLNVSVATFAHRGLLGIAVSPLPKTAISYTGYGNHNSRAAYVSCIILKPRHVLVTILLKESNHSAIVCTDMS